MAEQNSPFTEGYSPDWAKTDTTREALPAPAPLPPAAAPAARPPSNLTFDERYQPEWAKEPKPPSIFTQAAQKLEKYTGKPLPALPPEEYSKMPWTDVASRAIRSAPSSMAKTAEGVVTSLMPENLPETILGAGQLGYGLGSKGLGAAMSAFGYNEDPSKKAEGEAVLDETIRNLRERYGSSGKIQKSIAEDPFGSLSDFGSVMTLGGGGLSVVPGLGKIGRTIKTAGEIASPETLPIKAAMAVAPAGTYIGKSLLSGISGLSQETVNDFFKGGQKFDIGLLKKVLTEDPNPNAALEKVQNAFQSMRDERETNYLNSREGWKNSLVPLSFSGVDDAMNKSKSIFSGPHGVSKNQEALGAYNEILNKIQEFKNSGHSNMVAMDDLKQAIDDIGARYKGKKAKELVGQIRNSVKDTIVSHDSKYADMMDEYKNASDELTKFYYEIGDPSKAGSAGRVLRKLVSAQKDVLKKPLLESLEEKAPGIGSDLAALEVAQKKIPFTQAALTGMFGNWLHPGYGALMGLAAEPRIAATTAGLAGALSAPVSAATRTSIPLIAASDLAKERSQFRGGAIRRATGGRISRGMNAQMLIAAVERAKADSQKATEQILDQPDEHVVHALKIANGSINNG